MSFVEKYYVDDLSERDKPETKWYLPFLKNIKGKKILSLGCGPILYEALKAAKELEKDGIGVTVVNMPQVKPLDTAFLLRFVKDLKGIVTVEEHQVSGGLGSAIS